MLNGLLYTNPPSPHASSDARDSVCVSTQTDPVVEEIHQTGETVQEHSYYD